MILLTRATFLVTSCIVWVEIKIFFTEVQISNILSSQIRKVTEICSYSDLPNNEHALLTWMSAAKRQNIALKNSLFSGRRFVRRLFEHRAVRFWQWWLLWWKYRALFLHKMWMFGSGLLTFLMVQKNLSNDSIPIAQCCLTIFFFSVFNVY